MDSYKLLDTNIYDVKLVISFVQCLDHNFSAALATGCLKMM